MRATYGAPAVALALTMIPAWVEWNDPPTIAQVADQSGTLDKTFSLQLQVTGGWAPYTWRVEGLPAGLNASADGLISGTPVRAGTSTVTCHVTDGYTPPVEADMTFKIRVK